MPTAYDPPFATIEVEHREAPHVHLLVQEVMTVDPVTVAPTASVKRLAGVLIDHDIHCVPVVDSEGRLLGVVSEADLIVREGYPTVRSHTLAGAITDALAEHRHHWLQRTAGTTAADLMTPNVTTCRPDEPVAIVTRRLLSHGLKMLPVVADGMVVGVLSRRDVLRTLQQPDEDIRDRLAAVANDPLWMPDQHAVTFSVADGVVSVTGSVLYKSDAAVVLSIVRQLPGVIQVVDELTWQEPDPKPSYLHDTDLR